MDLFIRIQSDNQMKPRFLACRTKKRIGPSDGSREVKTWTFPVVTR